MFRLFVLAGVAAVAIALTPMAARAQVLDRIKKQATDKLKEKKQAADERIVTATGEVVDSVAEKSARGIDSAVTKTSNVLTTAVDRTEQGVVSVFRSGGGESALRNQLAAGHVVITDIQFADDGTVSPASQGVVRSLAKLLAEGTEAWMIEGHVAAGAGDQVLSDHRAKTIKSALVDEGVDPSRVWARGFGSTRPATAESVPADRIELVRMQ